MKVIGTGTVEFFEGEDECPHAPEPEELWQESFVIYTWDVEQEVYVFFRIAQTPNRAGGTSTVWLNVWTPELTYKHTDDSIAFDDRGRTKTKLAIGGDLCSYEYKGNHHWQLNDPEYDVQADLVFVDDHLGVNYFPKDEGTFIKEAARDHIQGGGQVSGTVKIQGKEYQVSGPGWRDHSWGPRDWTKFRAHRFYPAMFGKDLNFFNISFIGDDGALVKYGLVVREDSVQFFQDFSIIAYMGEDGISNCGGRVTLELDGEQLVIDYEPLGKAAVNLVHGGQCVDTMCRVRMGNRIGVGVAETSERAQGGEKVPFVLPSSPGILDNGIHPNA